jgi:predicted RNA-binding protein with PUA-like domain
MAHWLFKTEPDSYGIDRLEREGRTEWTGVRNFQARNNMMAMKLGELGFFYHSSCKPPGIAGLCRVVREAYPDFTQFDKKSGYFDASASKAKPKWYMVDVEFVQRFPRFIPLDELRELPQLTGMVLLKKSRLSVQPVENVDWNVIMKLAEAG